MKKMKINMIGTITEMITCMLISFNTILQAKGPFEMYT
jgi:hypothetical protein